MRYDRRKRLILHSFKHAFSPRHIERPDIWPMRASIFLYSINILTVFQLCSNRVPTVFQPCSNRVSTVFQPNFNRILLITVGKPLKNRNSTPTVAGFIEIKPFYNRWERFSLILQPSSNRLLIVFQLYSNQEFIITGLKTSDISYYNCFIEVRKLINDCLKSVINLFENL